MKLFCHLIIIVEMLLVNLLTVHHCSRQKYSGVRTLWTLLGTSAVVVGLLMPLLVRLPFYGNGNGLFVLAGFVYLLPLHLLYDQPLRRTVALICSAWIYTMGAFALSVHAARLLPAVYFDYASLGFQSVIYLVSVPFFIRFIENKLIYVLQHADPQLERRVLVASLIWFFTLVVINFTFVTQNGVFRLLSLILLSVGAVYSYLLLYDITRSSQSVENLQKIVYIDQLTGLPNRNSLLYEAERLLRRQCPFTLVFMDLDRFKQVNDHFGHLAGDDYLRQFAGCFKAVRSEEDGTLYRVSGDEFIFLATCTSVRLNTILDQVSSLEGRPFTRGQPFLGVSFGRAQCPRDAQTLGELIRLADQRMYEQKSLRQKLPGR